ncbi:hypothetical protein [Lentibacter algarum]|uniref:hypothetical protein n=1 Tax=Lentibacter algarum TaxID=576131 RepID=UPI0020900C49|nr:hypothetical protein [Lentibacter algarum]
MNTRHNPRLAITFMITATVFIATSTLMAKLASDPRFGTPLNPLQISHGRFTFAFCLISASFIALRGASHGPTSKCTPSARPLALRSFLGPKST